MIQLRKVLVCSTVAFGLLLLTIVLFQIGQPVAAAPALRPLMQETQPVTYTVQLNDTLVSIATRFSTTVSALQQENNLVNADLIRIGQVLRIPAPTPTPAPAEGVTTTATLTAGAAITTPGISVTDTATLTVTEAITESNTTTAELPAPTPAPEEPPVWAAPAEAIELFSPVADAVYHSPLEVIGFSRTFEGNVVVRLLDQSGAVIAERNATGGSVDGFDFFHTTLRFVAWDVQRATLEAFEISAQGGSEINKVSAAIIILPGQRALDLDFPAVGDTVCSPVIVAGYANTFEANLLAAMSQRDGTQLVQNTALGGNLGLYADFVTSLEYSTAAPQPILISASGADAIGLGPVDMTRVPVSIYPTGTTQCP
ncbi:MAG: Gmad2 immunoglobulin-like domain-containing protein [Caldilineaceae bacterium]